METLSIKNLKNRLKGVQMVVDANVYALNKDYLQDSITFTANESAKTLASIEDLCSKFLLKNLNRSSTIAAVGGGLTGDVVGLAASLYMRGIDWIYVPTTLLALVDSSIGGKTAVNLASTKNLIGTFHAPKQVIYCPEFLLSLPQSETNNGMAEIIKTAALDPATFDLVNQKAPLDALIKSCIAFKSKIVAQDPLDNSCRKQLNFGHTVGHALELFYCLPHGIAVALGMNIELHLAKATNDYLADFILKHTTNLIKHIKINPNDIKQIAKIALADKKNSNGKITLCIPKSHKQLDVVEINEQDFIKGLNQYITEAKC